MHFKLTALTLAAPLILAAGAAAQSADSVFFIGNEPGPMQMKTAGVSLKIDGADVSPIKGAPFCATVSTEHTQNLSDGNRIHTTESAQLCRDSEGRTRREAALNLMGAAPQTSTPKLVTIIDPVANVRYLLDASDKTAHKMPLMLPDLLPGDKGLGAPGKIRDKQIFMMESSGSASPEMLTKDVMIRRAEPDRNEDDTASESLGDQTIEGIHATGMRLTTTIPAGKMGNEKPITVISERWFSPELKVAVMTKHDDPWAGELKTEFKNVTITEPDASLFTVPADYKIIDAKDGPMKIRLDIKQPPAAQE